MAKNEMMTTKMIIGIWVWVAIGLWIYIFNFSNPSLTAYGFLMAFFPVLAIPILMCEKSKRKAKAALE